MIEAETILRKNERDGMNIVDFQSMKQDLNLLDETDLRTRRSRYREIKVQRNWKKNEVKRGIPNRILQGIGS